MEEHQYQYSIVDEKQTLAVIKLGVQALGGTDALNFTSRISELSGTGVKYLIADLSGVELMNSSGLGMLVNGMSVLKKFDIVFVLADLPQKIKDLLKMTHLDTIFKIYGSVADAIAALN